MRKTLMAALSLTALSFALATPASGVFPVPHGPSLRQLAYLKMDSLDKAVAQLRISGEVLTHRADRLQLIVQSN